MDWIDRLNLKLKGTALGRLLNRYVVRRARRRVVEFVHRR